MQGILRVSAGDPEGQFRGSRGSVQGIPRASVSTTKIPTVLPLFCFRLTHSKFQIVLSIRTSTETAHSLECAVRKHVCLDACVYSFLKTFGKPGSWSGVQHAVGGRAVLAITLSIIKMSLQVCNSPSWSYRVGKAKPHFPTFQRYSGSCECFSWRAH